MLKDFRQHQRNRLLGSLSRADFSELVSSLKFISLKAGEVLFHQGEEVNRIYFPHVGVISMFTVIDDGRQVETASVGFESGLGLMSGIGYHASRAKSVVQLPVIASMISSGAFRRIAEQNRSVFELSLRANDAFLDQIQMISGCNVMHTIESRLASMLLQSTHRMHGADLHQTQENLSAILGVTRSAVSEIAAKLQQLGLVRYSRGVIRVMRHAELARIACECRNLAQL